MPTSPELTPSTRFTRSGITYSIIFAAVIYFALVIWGNTGQLAQVFDHLQWRWVPLIFGLSLCNYLIRFANWQYYLGNLGITQVKRIDSVLIFLAGFSLTITPGKVGELLRSYLLKESYQVPISQTASLVFVDRITDLLALIVIAAVGAIHFRYGLAVLLYLLIVVLILLLAVSSFNLVEPLLSFLGRTRILGRQSNRLRTLYLSAHTLLQPKPLLIIFLISTLAWSCEGVGFYLVFKALGVSVSLFTALFIYAFSTILGALSFLPGGLGVAEASMTGLLVLANLSRSVATAATLLIRAATLWFSVILGILALTLFRLCQKKPF